MVGIDQLLSQARLVLKCAGKPEELEELIECYVALFEEWFQQVSVQEGNKDRQVDMENLERLHAEVIACADSLRVATLNELKSHRVKGKGIRAYTDRLPKRIGVMRGKKL